MEIIPFQFVFQRRDREQENSALCNIAPFWSILPVFSNSQSEAQSHKHHGPAQRRMRLPPTAKFSTARGSKFAFHPFFLSHTPCKNHSKPLLKVLETVQPDADLINNADSSKCRNSETFTTNLLCSSLRWCTTVQISGHKAYTRSLGFWSKELTVKWTELRCVRAAQT